jgi:hypothetical protein
MEKSSAFTLKFRFTLRVLPDQITMIKKIYTSLNELQDDLDQFIFYYNFKRTNQGYRLKGKIPYMKFLDGMRKFSLQEPV